MTELNTRKIADSSEVRDESTPRFCPHCGVAGALEEMNGVFVEEGYYNGESYLAEGYAVKHRCTACGGEFVEWQSGLTRADNEEPDEDDDE